MKTEKEWSLAVMIERGTVPEIWCYEVRYRFTLGQMQERSNLLFCSLLDFVGFTFNFFSFAFPLRKKKKYFFSSFLDYTVDLVWTFHHSSISKCEFGLALPE